MATRSTKTATKTTAKATKTAVKATKPAAKTTTAPAMAVATASPIATVVETVKPVVAGVQIKKPELIDRVMAETGMKKKDVKPVIEAMLAVLGRTLTGGEELNVPPLGKLMIKKSKDVSNATILTLKLRHPTNIGGGGNSDDDALAAIPD